MEARYYVVESDFIDPNSERQIKKGELISIEKIKSIDHFKALEKGFSSQQPAFKKIGCRICRVVYSDNGSLILAGAAGSKNGTERLVYGFVS